MSALAEMAPKIQSQEIDRDLRIRTDTSTWLAETLHGSMRTNFEFTFENGEIRGEDGGLLDDVFDEAIVEAKAMTEWNPSLLFELRRRLIEREELNDMYKMASGELPNTMIVISDFPPELMKADEDVGGYNITRQQTMMRVISLDENGVFHIASQSLDGSNRTALESIYESLAEPVEEGELLAQRIHRNLPEGWQKNLPNNLTKVYDSSLEEQFGGEWHAGISQRPDRNIVNTYDFVLAQQDLIGWFTSEKLANPANAEKLRYRLAATAKARHERYIYGLNSNGLPQHELNPESFITLPIVSYAHAMQRGLVNELNREGRRAAERGEVFSGCGGTVKAAGEEFSDLSTVGQLGELGYGNKAKTNDKSERDEFGSLTFNCRKGHKNTRERGKLKDECDTCKTSVRCK